jgi:hypothetical protein
MSMEKAWEQAEAEAGSLPAESALAAKHKTSPQHPIRPLPMEPPLSKPPTELALAAKQKTSPQLAPSATEWRRRRRREQSEEESDDDVQSVSSTWQPDARDVEMMHSLALVEAAGRMRLEGAAAARHGRRAKKMKTVDLGPGGLGGVGIGGIGIGSDGSGGGAAGGTSSSAGVSSMFTDVPLLGPADEHTGNALLCFLAPDTFVGFVEVEHEGESIVLKLTGSESLTECDRALCAVQDCCGDKAFLVTAQTTMHSRRKRTFLARSSGVGDYAAFEGRGMRFVTDFVPGDEQRAQVLRRHFGMLPKSAQRDSVLCLGQMTLHFRQLGATAAELEGGVAADERRGRPAPAAPLAASRDEHGVPLREHEGYAGDKSDCESSGDEQGELRSSMRAILPMLAGVAMPSPAPTAFSIDDLIARGGRVRQHQQAGGGDYDDDDADWDL